MSDPTASPYPMISPDERRATAVAATAWLAERIDAYASGDLDHDSARRAYDHASSVLLLITLHEGIHSAHATALYQGVRAAGRAVFPRATTFRCRRTEDSR